MLRAKAGNYAPEGYIKISNLLQKIKELEQYSFIREPELIHQSSYILALKEIKKFLECEKE